MEIEVGDYVRDRAGHIRRVTRHIPHYKNDLLCSDSCSFELDNNSEAIYTNKWLKEIIVNHSKDIIDLIEEDDYVNGFRIKEIVEKGQVLHNFYDKSVIDKDEKANRKLLFIDERRDNYIVKIKSILTHEQYENNAYRLEE